MAGRIEVYVHSDNVTKNKAAAMVRVSCQTDFAAKTEAFIAFCKDVAKYACAFQIDNPTTLFALAAHGELPSRLEALQAEIRETVSVQEIKLMVLPRHEVDDALREMPNHGRSRGYAEISSGE